MVSNVLTKTRDGVDGSRPVTVVIDADTVLLVSHHGKYGPELGLQADLIDSLGRLAEVADHIVVIVDPANADGRSPFSTERRVNELRGGLGDLADSLTIATCPHEPGARCDCEKPQAGLIEQALNGSQPSHGHGWYIGGDQEGMVSGRTAGLRTIRIGPHGEDHLSTVHRPDYEARDLMDAANHILVETLAP